MIIWDIETGPQPDDRLRQIFGDPDVGIADPGQFDPSSVKVGNLKDAAKIKEKIDAAAAEHAALADSYPQRLAEAKAAAFAEFKSRAALSATTGQILCVGYHNPETDKTAIYDGANKDGDTPEVRILGRFWAKFEECKQQKRPMIGLNIHDFDLPFIMRRSWILGVETPRGVLTQGRFWCDTFIDLRKLWLCGQMANGTKSSFDELAAAFGTSGKPSGISGGDFARLWEEDRATAIAYLENDLKQPAKWAAAMGAA